MNPTHDIIKEGDIVVMFTSRTSYEMLTMTQGKVYQGKFGIYPHSSIIGKQFGDIIKSKKNDGYMYALALTPTLYSHVLAHRTQVLYHETISPVLEYFDITPNSIIVESGTGSGCLSTSFGSRLIMGGVKGKGHLYTFEFHELRKLQAEEDFNKLGLGEVITTTLRDSVKDGFLIDQVLLPNQADCVFLDLPNVHEAIGHAYDVLKIGGKIACFCPCIEQIQKSCEVLQKDGHFTSLLTKEFILRPYSVKSAGRRGETGDPTEILCCPTKSIKGHVGYLTFAMKAK
ncbi:tRNA (adenine(58)-N(1))-methyltransferase [Entamoeba marina]